MNADVHDVVPDLSSHFNLSAHLCSCFQYEQRKVEAKQDALYAAIQGNDFGTFYKVASRRSHHAGT